jgi:formate-dependent nitrite reductase membrane component NrfD
VRRPEKETRPKLFYRGAHQATLDPLAAHRPGGGLFLWSQQLAGAHHVVSGHPDVANSSAAAVLTYDVAHKVPWDWRVSLYTLTKGIAGGAYLVPLLLLLFGEIEATSPLWLWIAPVVAGLFLALTGGLLIWDLEHPERFYMIFTRSHWRSWLVRGAYVIGAYSLVLLLHILVSGLAATGTRGPTTMALAWAGLPLAAMTAVYTAYLFAQAKARDLWQSPLLPPHLLVQAVLGGAAALLPAAWLVAPEALSPLLWMVAGSSLVHLLMVTGETTLTHTTSHAHLASHEMTQGRFRSFFWAGMLLTAITTLAPWIGASAPGLVALVALTGLLAFEHAYVQAGQSVPLA